MGSELGSRPWHYCEIDHLRNISEIYPMTRHIIPGLLLSFGLAVCQAVAADGLKSLDRSDKPAQPVPDLKLDDTTSVVLKKAGNGMAANTQLISTPSFPNYNLAPVVDGIRNRQELGWQQNAWASEEDPSPHGIEIRLGKPARGGRFQVTWAYDVNNDAGGRWWISRNYCIQIKKQAGTSWQTVVRVKDNQSAIGSYPLPDEPFSFLRIVQLPQGGHPLRPNMMWVGQVELTE